MNKHPGLKPVSHGGSRRSKLAALRACAAPLALALTAIAASSTAAAATALADAPVFSRSAILGNVALALSVEWPTAERAAYPGTNDYSSANTYKGYFDPNKCYDYQYHATVALNRYFVPAAVATNRTCSSKWSGNFLNWAATQTIDPFRLVMTGGYRVRDELSLTVLQKANHPATGQLFPNKSLPAAQIAGATPFGALAAFNMRINGAGFDMLFTVSGNVGAINAAVPATTDYNPANALNNATVYRIPIRVKVCDPAAPGGLETNCKKYGSNAKPEGLMQQYSQRLRFAALGYLNQSGNDRDGAVLRARMKYVGSTYPVPSAPDATNAAAEWDPNTGIFVANPDPADATATNTAYVPTTPVTNSGVANYLNKFGQIFPANGYKGNDPVSELYYAAQRYFRNIGAVPEWNTLRPTTTVDRALDGFPVVRDWDDPIQYACQKNFILGIGDIYTHADKNIPGATGTTLEPAKPASVAADTAVDAQAATNLAFALQGLSAPNPDNYSGRYNSAGMVGLAYWANVNDIRPDVAGIAKTQGKQTIQTLWVDVLEQPFVSNNQFYLAAKYGGFIPPANLTPPYSFANTTPLDQTWWSTNGDAPLATGQPRPDNYFTAGNPDQMITGLTKAFQRINALSAAFTTSFSTSLPQVSVSGNASFGAQYDASNWTGEVVASELNFAADGTPSLVERWRAKNTLATQLAGTGWNTNRTVVSWNGTAGVPFRSGSLTAAQLTALDTNYRTGNDSSDYLNYLRGDRSQETDSTVAGSSHAYRKREALLGDIVGSRAKPIGPPSFPLADGLNPGYDAFKTLYKNRKTVVYLGANDGMMHAFSGDLTGTGAGQEIFAYVPSALFNGPSSPATPNVDGLALLGNPDMEHHFLVNATPANFDIDFTRTWNGSGVGTGAADWHSILVGGLGKGGRSYYALDITDPSTITSASAATKETVASSKVLWEFSDARMGFSYGEPVFVKTRKYGWTVILPSGYNTPDGSGYIFFVHPRTGALLEAVSTKTDSATVDTGLGNINAYVLDYTDGYADAIYGGDLQGNLWRFDISAASGTYPDPIVMARLTDSSGNAQPVTSRPIAELHPKTKERVVMVGTGKLLSQNDRSSTQEQTFYAIKDGNSVRFNRATDLPTGVNFPIIRANLQPNPNWVAGVTGAAANSMGFYTDLGRDAASGIAWRVVSDPTSFLGVVAFTSTLPSVTDPCQPSGSSRIYAGDFVDGLSKLLDSSNAAVNYIQNNDGVVTDLRFLSVGGRARLITGTDQGAVRQMRGSFGSALGLRRINWREVRIGN
ncbi:MAG: pilus assembly protein [Proteobacteria bacterium]|nr:pilus assembly protein [Pseudomonadota bacterium]